MEATADLLTRLDRIERRCRRLERLAIAALLALPLLWMLRTTHWYEGRRVIRAGSFVVTDGEGRRHASLNQKKDGSYGLRINDDHGSMRVLLTVNPHGEARLALYDGTEARPVFTAP